MTTPDGILFSIKAKQKHFRDEFDQNYQHQIEKEQSERRMKKE
jgi:hypothetical protein